MTSTAERDDEPKRRPGPYAMPVARAGLRLHVFSTGANRMSPLLVGANPPWRHASAFVIEHPREGLVVFDLGLSEAVARLGEAALGVPMRWLFKSCGRANDLRHLPSARGDLLLHHPEWFEPAAWPIGESPGVHPSDAGAP